MKKFKTVQSQFGFSLVGILVGVALLGILTAGMMQVFSNMALNQNYSKFRTQVDNFGEELRSSLGDKTICTATFGGIQMDPSVPINFTAIKDGTGKTIYAVNSTYGDNSFILAAISLKTLADGSLWYIEDNAATGTGRMTVSVTYKAAGPQSGPKESFRTYVMETHRNLATGKLIDCTALGKASGDGIWKYSNVDIYFSGGNVGIGTTSPTTMLDVVAPDSGVTVSFQGLDKIMQFYNGNGTVDRNEIFMNPGGANAFSIRSTPTSFDIFRFTGAPLFASSALNIDKASGNVGIGTTGPRAALEIANGAFVSKSATLNAAATIDFATGNLQYSTGSCQAFKLNNLKDGGSYMFSVQGGAATTCSFTAYSDAGVTALTVHMPPDHAVSLLGKHTLYNFAVMGTHVYVAWTPGY